jgi:hypothetical protein
LRRSSLRQKSRQDNQPSPRGYGSARRDKEGKRKDKQDTAVISPADAEKITATGVSDEPNEIQIIIKKTVPVICSVLMQITGTSCFFKKSCYPVLLCEVAKTLLRFLLRQGFAGQDEARVKIFLGCHAAYEA